MSSLKRIMNDYNEIQNNPYDDELITVETINNNYYKWQCTILGQSNTIYDTGVFFLDIDIPGDYPHKPPTIKFTTKIYHPNIELNGGICMSMLTDTWSPKYTIRHILDEINKLLYTPDIDSALRADIANQYKSDLAAYEHTAREWTQKYAQ